MSDPITEAEILNRFGYHAPSPESIEEHELIREGFIAFAKFLRDKVPAGRARSLAFTALQEASMWSNFAIAERQPVVHPRPTGKKDQRMITEVSSARRAVPR